MKVVNVAVIGCGFIAQTAHIPNLLRIPEARLVAAVDVNKENLNLVTTKFNVVDAYSDYRTILKQPNIDAVLICTPVGTHTQIGIEAAENGKHIFCEKPIASNSSDADAMIKAADKNNVKLMIGHFSRFLPNHKIAKEVIDKGQIGDVFYVEAHSETLTVKPDEGVLLDYGVHLIDLVCWFLDYRDVDWVAGLVHSSIDGVSNTEASLIMRFDNGTIGRVGAFWMAKWESWSAVDRFVKILGTRGKINSELTGPALSVYKDGTLFGRLRGVHRILPRQAAHSKLPLTNYGYIKEVEHFIECINQDKEPSVTGRQGKMVVEIVEATLKSSKEKNILQVKM